MLKGKLKGKSPMTARWATRKPTGKYRIANGGPKDNKPGKFRKEKGNKTYFHSGVDKVVRFFEGDE
jgi:hypothetical protein